jgi:hypothetical protein
MYMHMCMCTWRSKATRPADVHHRDMLMSPDAHVLSHVNTCTQGRVVALHTRFEIRCLGTCADPELIDTGSVVAFLVSGTDSYGSLSEAKAPSDPELRYLSSCFGRTRPRPGAVQVGERTCSTDGHSFVRLLPCTVDTCTYSSGLRRPMFASRPRQ